MNCSTTSPSETPPTAHKRRSHQQLAQRLSFIDKIMLAPCWFAFFGCVAKLVCATARRFRHLVLVPPASDWWAENKIEQHTLQLAGWYWTAAVGAARRPKLPRHPLFKPTSWHDRSAKSVGTSILLDKRSNTDFFFHAGLVGDHRGHQVETGEDSHRGASPVKHNQPVHALPAHAAGGLQQ